MYKKYQLLLGCMLLGINSYCTATTGPQLNKTLDFQVLSQANINASWVPEQGLSPSKVMEDNVIIGTLSFSNTSIQTISIESKDAQDNTKNGVVSFINTASTDRRFGTNISSDNSSVIIEKNLGKTLIRSTNDGELLPNNLDVKFKTVAGNTNVVSGNYQASISITTTIK